MSYTDRFLNKSLKEDGGDSEEMELEHSAAEQS